MKSILIEQAKYSIVECLKELKFGRPAKGQKLLDKLIKFAKKESVKLALIIPFILASCSTTKPPTGKLIVKSITVSSDRVVFKGTLKATGISPEALQQQINEAAKGILSVDKLYVNPADTSANADFTLTSPIIK